jgi:filamentous hemagglutinin family protein
VVNPLYANPEGGSVAAGQATITNTQGLTTINQSTDKAIINWQGFSINAGEETHFQQPSSSSITLNRVTGNQASQIMGKLSANGHIMLLNPSGIIFGPNSRVDVASLTATTANIKDSDFLSGNYHFVQNPAYNKGIVNQGTITVADRGLVALVAPSVENSGKIVANVGKVTLAAGTEFTVDLQGDETIQFAAGAKVAQSTYTPDGELMKDAVRNSGQIYANGGKVVLTTQTVENIVDNAVNMDGVIQANSMGAGNNGQIILSGGNTGITRVAGTLDVSGLNENETAGKIKILGEHVKVDNGAHIKAVGNAGGGEILIGGNYQGKGPEMNATTTTIANDVNIDASAVKKGNGGKIIVWSNDTTQYLGHISATGGAEIGDGGFAEISGKNRLQFQGTIDLSSPQGKVGSLLLDPHNITILKTGATTGGFFNTNYDATTDDSVILFSDLINALTNADVTIQTGSDGTQLGNITIGNVGDNTYFLSGNHTLTLLAANDIIVNAPIANDGTTTTNLVLHADADANGVGTISFDNSASIDYTNPSGGSITFYYNPASYPTATDFSTKVFKNSNNTFAAYMLVNDIDDLQNINSNLSGAYALAKNIDASDTASWNNGAGFIPIGNNGSPFTGQFNGNAYVINNLYINLPSTIDNVGLFGTTQNATITSVGLQNATIIGGTGSTGGLVGFAKAGTSISKSYVVGNISAPSNQSTASQVGLGGFVGYNKGSISQSFASGSISGGASSGGSAFHYLGGFVGINEGGNIDSSYSNTAVIMDGSSNYEAGGFVGITKPDDVNFSGGFISNSYSTGAIVNAPFLAFNVGGFVGGAAYSASNPLFNNNYWDTATSGTTSAGFIIRVFGSDNGHEVTGLTTSAMMTHTNLPSTWFSSNVWGYIDGIAYPYLKGIYTTTPQVISGTVNTTGGIQVNLTHNGTPLAMTTTGRNGFYYTLLPNSTIGSQEMIVSYLKNSSLMGNTVGIFNDAGTYLTGNNIYVNTITGVNASSISAMDASNFTTALNTSDSQAAPYILQFDGTSGVLISGNGIGFKTETGTNYTLDSNITTNNGSISIGGTLYLTGSSGTRTLSAGAGNISLQQVSENIAGSHDLVLNSTGTTTINGNIGASAAVKSLTTNAGGTTRLNNSSIHAINDINFNDTLTITTSAVNITSDSGDLNFNKITTTAASALTLQGETINFNDTVGTISNPFTQITVNAPINTINLYNNVFANTITSAAQQVNVKSTNADIADAVQFTGAGGLLNFDADVNHGSNIYAQDFSTVGRTTPLTIAQTSPVTFNTINHNSSGTLTITGGTWNTAISNFNTMSFDGPVVLTGDTVLNSGASITFTNALTGNYILTVNPFTFAYFNNTGNYTQSLGGIISNVSSSGDGFVKLAGPITTNNATGMQFNTVVSLAGNTILTANNGDITFGDTIFSSPNINLSLSGNTVTFAGIVGAANNLQQLNVNANTINVNADILSNSIDGNASTVNLNTSSTQINDGYYLTGNGGTINIKAPGIYAETLTFDKAINVNTYDGDITVNSLTANNNLGINGNWTVTQGDFIFNSPVTLTGNTSFNAGNNNIQLKSTVDGNYTLVLNANTDKIIQYDIGSNTAVNSFTSNGPGKTLLGANITAQGNTITFNNAVEMINNSTLTDLGTSGIHFNSTLDGPYNLTLSAVNGNILFANTVGGTQNIANLTITNAHNVTANAAVNVNNFEQQYGQGVTDFTQGLTAQDNIRILTDGIIGNFVGQDAKLIGMSRLSATVDVKSLTVGGNNGGEISGTISNISGKFASLLARLTDDASGDFVFNGCLLPGGCVASIASNSIIDDAVNESAEKLKPRACTAAATKEGDANTCEKAIEIKDELVDHVQKLAQLGDTEI